MLSGYEGSQSWDRFSNFLSKEFGNSKPLLDETIVLVVDEAQHTYLDGEFWNDIIKNVQSIACKYDIQICLFCSYGSPRAGPEAGTVFYTPPYIGSQHRVTLTPQTESSHIGLFYTEVECEEVISRLLRTQKPPADTAFRADAKKYIYQLTNGHPGGVESVVVALLRVCC